MPDNNVMTFTITGADGVEKQVEVPSDVVFAAVEGAGYVESKKVSKDIDRRVNAIIKNKGLKDPKELLTDEEFLAQVREGYVKAEEGSEAARQLREALAKQERDYNEKKLKPLQDALAERDAREETLLERDLERQIVQAAREAGVQERFLKSRNGRPALIVQQLSGMFAFDDDTREFYAADGDNFKLSKRDGDNTYQDVAEAVADWAQDPENADLLDKTGQGGPGSSRRNGGGGGNGGGEVGTVVLTEAEAADTPTWNQALAKVGGDASKIRVKKDAARSIFM